MHWRHATAAPRRRRRQYRYRWKQQPSPPQPQLTEVASWRIEQCQARTTVMAHCWCRPAVSAMARQARNLTWLADHLTRARCRNQVCQRRSGPVVTWGHLRPRRHAHLQPSCPQSGLMMLVGRSVVEHRLLSPVQAVSAGQPSWRCHLQPSVALQQPQPPSNCQQGEERQHHLYGVAAVHSAVWDAPAAESSEAARRGRHVALPMLDRALPWSHCRAPPGQQHL